MIVRPRTSTATIKKMGRSGELRNAKYDGSKDLIGRPIVAEQLFLSYWLRGFTSGHHGAHLRQSRAPVPFFAARQKPVELESDGDRRGDAGASRTGPPFPIDLDRIAEDSRHYQAADVALELETWWDLWGHNGDWKLEPARAVITCFGPEFENHLGENLRVDFGIDSRYLPDPEISGSARVIQSNIRSLLKLVHDLDDALPVEKRQLWSETGENFVERLQTVLSLSQ